MGIESYSIHTMSDEFPKNQLTVNFVFLGKAMEPKDYQPFIDKLQALCKEFNLITQH